MSESKGSTSCPFDEVGSINDRNNSRIFQITQVTSHSAKPSQEFQIFCNFVKEMGASNSQHPTGAKKTLPELQKNVQLNWLVTWGSIMA